MGPHCPGGRLFSVPTDRSLAPIVINGPLAAGGDVGSVLVSPDGTRVIYEADREVNNEHHLLLRPDRRRSLGCATLPTDHRKSGVHPRPSGLRPDIDSSFLFGPPPRPSPRRVGLAGHIATVQALARLEVTSGRRSDELAGWLDEIAMRRDGAVEGVGAASVGPNPVRSGRRAAFAAPVAPVDRR